MSVSTPPPIGAAREPDTALAWRSPANRYENAAEAAYQGRVLLRRAHDRETCELTDYLLAERESHDPASRAALQRRRPDIAAVLEIHRDPAKATAFVIEALTLARVKSSAITARTGIPSRVITLYQDCFYNFGKLIHSQAYVWRFAGFSVLFESPPPEVERQAMLKLIAYACGPQTLDHLLGVGVQSSPSEVWRTAPAFMEQVRLWEIIRANLKHIFAPSSPIGAGDLSRWADEFTARIRSSPLTHTATSPIAAL